MTAPGFLSLVIVGHVDHGKSTLSGRLLADTGSLPQGKLEQLRRKCEAEGRPFEYAFLLDSMRDEQDQRITIDTTRIFFRTPKRRYMLFDAPGHTEFLRNMVTGAAKADAGFLVIDAREGVRENSRRHGLLLSLLGVGQVAVLVNKMDLVSRSRREFEKIRSEYGRFLAKLGVKPVHFIPVSAYEGENVVKRSDLMPWYSGPTALEALEAFEGAKSLENHPFRMPVQGVYPFAGGSAVAGLVESGAVLPGERLVFYPSAKPSTLRAIEGAPSAEAGRSVGLVLEAGDAEAGIVRGELACREGEREPKLSSELRARVFWLAANDLELGARCVLKLGTARREARVEAIESVFSAETLDGRPDGIKDARVRSNEVAELRLSLDHPLAHEIASEHPALGRFVLCEGFEIGGGGIILG